MVCTPTTQHQKISPPQKLQTLASKIFFNTSELQKVVSSSIVCFRYKIQRTGYIIRISPNRYLGHHYTYITITTSKIQMIDYTCTNFRVSDTWSMWTLYGPQKINEVMRYIIYKAEHKVRTYNGIYTDKWPMTCHGSTQLGVCQWVNVRMCKHRINEFPVLWRTWIYFLVLSMYVALEKLLYCSSLINKNMIIATTHYSHSHRYMASSCNAGWSRCQSSYMADRCLQVKARPTVEDRYNVIPAINWCTREAQITLGPKFSHKNYL